MNLLGVLEGILFVVGDEGITLNALITEEFALVI